MEIFKSFNLNVEQQRSVIVWLSGVYGLLVGIISMFVVELRLGIESWLHLLIILSTVGLFVVACNSIVKHILLKKRNNIGVGKKFWVSVLSLFPILILTAITLAIRI